MLANHTEDPDLFGKKDTRWESLNRSASGFSASPLDAWNWMYSQWKSLYRQFRDLEKSTLYAVDKVGGAIKSDEGTLRNHRQSIAALILTGEDLAMHLDQFCSLIQEADEKDEAHGLKLKQGVLLESLRESMELWHPANKQDPPSAICDIFNQG